jgi:hypothetical protein
VKSPMRSLLVMLALASLPACSGGSDPTLEGDLGEVDFTYVSGFACMLGCSLSDPLPIGVTQRVRVSATSPGDTLPALTLRSSDPTILAIGDVVPSATLLGLELTGTALGATKLELFKGTKLYDSVTVLVETPASLGLDLVIPTGPPTEIYEETLNRVQTVSLTVGQMARLTVDVIDVAGNTMAAWGTTSESIDDPAVATLAQTPDGPSLTTVKAGSTTLVLRAGKLERKVPVTVTAK